MAVSPLIRNAQARRFSLELCQTIGNQLLSPSAAASPGRNATNNMHCSWSANVNKAHSPTSPSTACRRGSADQGVIKSSRSPLSPYNGNRGRRSSLTPLPSLASGQSLINSVSSHHHHHHPPIPSIHIQKSPGHNSRLDFDEHFTKFVATSCNLQLNPGNVLGRGSFGTVIQGTMYKGQRVAVKIINTKLPGHLESLVGERNAHTLPPHLHIAKVLHIFQTGPERALIVMELLRKGSLLNLLHDYRFHMDFLKMINFSGQVASALQFCHEHGILHLDVKPKNILLDWDDNCKLADFGTSKRIHDIPHKSKSNKLDGTVAYKAPELFQNNSPTEKCDVYSFGICMWQILQRENPYQGQPEHQIIYQVVAQNLRPGKFTERSHYNNNFIASSHLLPQYIQVYEMCWLADPNLRPDMKHVVGQLLFLSEKYKNDVQH